MLMERYFKNKRILLMYWIERIGRKMDKNNPFFTASAASVLYFVIYIIIKYFGEQKIDLQGALIGAIIFWIVIFIVHKLLNRRFSEN